MMKKDLYMKDKKSQDKIRDLILGLLEEIGEDSSREGLLKTPERVAQSWEFFSRGYRQKLGEIINHAIFHEDAKDMVVVRDVEFFSLCEHHLLPFFGKAYVGYIPDGRVIGLSKIPRVIDMFFGGDLMISSREPRPTTAKVK